MNLIMAIGWSQVLVEQAEAYVPAALGLVERGTLEEARLHVSRGLIQVRAKDFAGAEQTFLNAIDLLEKTNGPRDEILVARNLRADVLDDLGREREAEAEQRAVLEGMRELFGDEHPHTIAQLINLGNCVQSPEEQERLLRQAVELAQTVLGPEHHFVGAALTNLGVALGEQERHADAIEVFRRSLRVWETLPTNPELAKTHRLLGESLFAEKRHAEAESVHRTALELQLSFFGQDGYPVAVCRLGLGDVLFAQGRYDEAREQASAALEIGTTARGARSTVVAVARSDLGRTLTALERLDEAERELLAAQAVLVTKHGEDDPHVLEVRRRLDAVNAARRRR